MSDLKYYYITTPIYYVNDVPHIGHAYTSIVADVLARFMRLDGHNVMFLTGTDEHGQKVAKAAELRSLSVQDYVDQTSDKFQELARALHITYDDFMRTTQPRHIKTAQLMWQKLLDQGYIYKGKYAGWYCVRDEAFYDESELVDGRAPTGAEVEWVEESSYFFALSKFQQPLLDYYQKNPDFVKPNSRRNEVMRFVESGLHDLSISRTSFKWGVPVPGDPDHVMYVWLDALTNYLTALNYGDSTDTTFDNYWPQAIHLLGKDILRFHAVYWPAFLMAAGIQLPKSIVAHGWWTIEGQKMSKSLGNVIDPLAVSKKFGVDQLRYFLLSEKSLSNDGDFSKQNFINRVNADLANDFGNLVQRVLSFVHKNADATIPQPDNLTSADQTLLADCKTLIDTLRADARDQAPHKMCVHIWQIIGAANRYVDSQAPWALKKTDPTRMQTVLYVLIDVIRHLAILSSPIVPLATTAIMDQLNLPDSKRCIATLNNPLSVGTVLPQPKGVFPRIVADDDGVIF